MAYFTKTIGTPSGGFTLKVVYSYTQDLDAGISYVTATGYVKRNNSAYYPSSDYATAKMQIGDKTKTLNGTVSYKLNTNDYDKIITYSDVPIPHDADGTKSIKIKLTFDGNRTSYYPNGSASRTITLDAIPMKTTPVLSADSLSVGEQLQVTLPRKQEAFEHTVSIVLNDEVLVEYTGIQDTFSYDIPESWANYLPNSTSETVTLKCDTYNGETLVGTSSKTFSLLIPESIIPTINSITISEANEDMITQFAGSFIQAKSKYHISVDASGIYGSSISSYLIILNNNIYSESDFIAPVINGNGEYSLEIAVTDSRGRSITDNSSTITVTPYTPPAIENFQVDRCDENGELKDEGTYVKATVLAKTASCEGKNIVNYTISYRASSEDDWVQIYPATIYSDDLFTIDTNMFLVSPEEGGFSDTKSYEFQMTLSDYFSESPVTYEVTLSTSFELTNYNPSGMGVAFGKVSEKEFGMEIAMPVEVTEVFNITKNRYVNAGVTGVENTAGYVGIAEITINGTYLDSPFVFAITNRAVNMPTNISILFASGDTIDPEIAAFNYSGAKHNIYATKAETSTWKIYVQKNKNDDYITVNDFYTSSFNESEGRGYSIKWIDELVTELPATYHKAIFANAANNLTTQEEGFYLDARQGATIGKLINILTTSYPLEVSYTNGTNWTLETDAISATLCGNSLLFYFHSTRSEAVDGNVTNQVIVSATINHGGKITSAYDVTFTTGSYGGTSSMYTHNMTLTDTTLSFNVSLGSTGGSSKSANPSFIIPVTLNLNAF